MLGPTMTTTPRGSSDISRDARAYDDDDDYDEDDDAEISGIPRDARAYDDDDDDDDGCSGLR